MLDLVFINETNERTDDFEALIEKVFQKVCEVEGITIPYEVSVIFVDNAKIHEINREYRQIDRPTDVISFAMQEGEVLGLEDEKILGDIFISIEQAKIQAENYGHSLEREMGFLACHGLLHLLGYDHQTKEQETEMFTKQEAILNQLKLMRDTGGKHE